MLTWLLEIEVSPKFFEEDARSETSESSSVSSLPMLEVDSTFEKLEVEVSTDSSIGDIRCLDWWGITEFVLLFNRA